MLGLIVTTLSANYKDGCSHLNPHISVAATAPTDRHPRSRLVMINLDIARNPNHSQMKLMYNTHNKYKYIYIYMYIY
jgi:hypothetical protein